MCICICVCTYIYIYIYIINTNTKCQTTSAGPEAARVCVRSAHFIHAHMLVVSRLPGDVCDGPQGEHGQGG